MKNNKLIITGIATVLCVGALAGSLATYIQYEGDKTINIEVGEVGSNVGTVTLGTNSIVNKKLNPKNYSNTFKHTISYEKPTKYTQTGVMVDMQLKVTILNEAVNLLDVTPSFTGYGKYWQNQANTIFKEGTTVAGETHTVKTFDLKSYPLDGKQEFNLAVTLKELNRNYDSFATIAEKENILTYDFVINEMSDSNFKYAYLRGTMEGASWMNDSPLYQMTVNTQSDKYEWTYTTDAENFPINTEFRGVNGSNWSDKINGLTADQITTNGSNAKIVTAGVYNLFWDGVNNTQIYLSK